MLHITGRLFRKILYLNQIFSEKSFEGLYVYVCVCVYLLKKK